MIKECNSDHFDFLHITIDNRPKGILIGDDIEDSIHSISEYSGELDIHRLIFLENNHLTG